MPPLPPPMKSEPFSTYAAHPHALIVAADVHVHEVDEAPAVEGGAVGPDDSAVTARIGTGGSALHRVDTIYMSPLAWVL